jgi:hypothetical protein
MSTIVSVTELAAPELDRISRRLTLYSAPRWLEMAEGSSTIRTAYVVAHLDGRVAGVLPFHRSDSWPSGGYDPATLFPEVGEAEQWSPASIAGNKAAFRTELLVDPDLDSAEREEVLRALVDGLEAELAGTGEERYRFMYVPGAAAAELEGVLGERSVALLTGGDTRLDLAGSGFDDYVASLGQHRRRAVRRERERFLASGAEVRRVQLADCVDAIAPLFAQLSSKHGQDMPLEVAQAILSHFSRFLSEQSVVFLAERDGELAGCSLFLRQGNGLYGRMVGFDYDRSVPGDYFNLCFHEPVVYAGEHGQDTISFGPTGYAAKLLRGAAFEPLWCVLASRDAVSQSIQDAAGAWNRSTAERFANEYGPFVRGGLRASELEQPSGSQPKGEPKTAHGTVVA